jgi:hypothetical protein
LEIFKHISPNIVMAKASENTVIVILLIAGIAGLAGLSFLPTNGYLKSPTGYFGGGEPEGTGCPLLTATELVPGKLGGWKDTKEDAKDSAETLCLELVKGTVEKLYQKLKEKEPICYNANCVPWGLEELDWSQFDGCSNTFECFYQDFDGENFETMWILDGVEQWTVPSEHDPLSNQPPPSSIQHPPQEYSKWACASIAGEISIVRACLPDVLGYPPIIPE